MVDLSSPENGQTNNIISRPDAKPIRPPINSLQQMIDREQSNTEAVPKPDLQTANVIEALKPRDFVDADGIDRQLFTFTTPQGSEVQAVFYSKEDLPFDKQILEGRNGFIIGTKPNFRAEEEWQEFIKDVSQASANKSSPLQINSPVFRDTVENGSATIFVENSPVGLIDFASIVGTIDPKWREARRLAAVDRRFTPEVLDLIDSVIAGAHVDDSGKIGPRNKQEGEVLAVMALTGDEKAKTLLEQKKDVVRQMESLAMQKRKEQADHKLADLEAKGIKPYSSETLFHATRFKPVRTEKGLEIETTFDGSKGKQTRVSIHLHPGEVLDDHAMGSWDKASYIVSGDLKAIVEANPDNAILRTVSPFDIYFTVSPGTRLVIPDGVLTKPGILPEGTLRENRGNEIIYKKEMLKPKDIDSYVEKYPKVVQTPIGEVFMDPLCKILEKVPGTNTLADPNQFKELQTFTKQIDTKAFWDVCRTEGVKAAVDSVLNSYTFDPLDQSLSDQIADIISRSISTSIRNNRVGYSYQMKGDLMGENSWFAATAYSFGAKFDPTTEAHFNENWAGNGKEDTLYIFKRLEEHQAFVREELSRDPNAHVLPHVMLWNNNWVGTDRKSIMAYLQNQRHMYGEHLCFDRNERRGDFLSGML